jgi:hypothetical protein
MNLTSEFLTCAACGKTAKNGWTSEKMIEEFHRLHPGVEFKDTVVICDDCHKIEIELGLVGNGTKH